ncbi:MAG: mercuric transport protein MerTP [Sphingobacteriales bacterium]|nr:MAG: mercuric transport protein MerTP [Sphingobacteriales bacterium]
MSNERTASSIGLVAATAASLCCITPLVALVAGASGSAASLEWLAPLRPYLIGLSVLALGFAWYQSFRGKEEALCAADGTCTVTKKPFLASKTFLLLVTVATALLVAFPYYSKAFYPKPSVQTAVVAQRTNIQTVTFTIKGMTCAGCEEHVNTELAKVPGMIQSVTSYAKRSSVVKFDKSEATVEQLRSAIDKTGYTVVATKLDTNGSAN